MTHRGTRASGILLTVLVEAVLVVALLTVGPQTAAPAVATTSVAAFDVMVPAPPSVQPSRLAVPTPAPITPPEPIIVPPPAIVTPPSEMVTSLLTELDRTSRSGGACDLSGPVQLALQTSPAVQDALSQIPTVQRSVANAVMLWDGSWNAASERLAPAALQVIRDVIAGTAAAAGEGCRLQLQSGPRLLYLPGNGATTVLAMGSGEWRWQDVIDTVVSPNASQPPLTVAARLSRTADPSVARPRSKALATRN